VQEEAKSLRDRWEAHAQQWITWARAPGHDSYWRHHRDQFLKIVPAPGRCTVDIGCGEGRLARDLKRLGHRMIAIDASPTLVAAAREADTSMDIRLGDAAALPLADSIADLAVAFMSMQDVDAMPVAIREAARVLEPGGKLCMAVVHPINSAGDFADRKADSIFVIKRNYLGTFDYADTIERDGIEMTFHSRHHSLESYSLALEAAGFVIEALREPAFPDYAVVSDSDRRWQWLPLFLHLHARRL
jgi:SAM-dependent methyltransferase